MPTPQEALTTLNTLRDELARRGFSGIPEIPSTSFNRILAKLDEVVDEIQTLLPPPQCPGSWQTCKCPHHLAVRAAYQADLQERQLREAHFSD